MGEAKDAELPVEQPQDPSKRRFLKLGVMALAGAFLGGGRAKEQSRPTIEQKAQEPPTLPEFAKAAIDGWATFTSKYSLYDKPLADPTLEDDSHAAGLKVRYGEDPVWTSLKVAYPNFKDGLISVVARSSVRSHPQNLFEDIARRAIQEKDPAFTGDYKEGEGYGRNDCQYVLIRRDKETGPEFDLAVFSFPQKADKLPVSKLYPYSSLIAAANDEDIKPKPPYLPSSSSVNLNNYNGSQPSFPDFVKLIDWRPCIRRVLPSGQDIKQTTSA